MSLQPLLLAILITALAEPPGKIGLEQTEVDRPPTATANQPVESITPASDDGIWPSQKLMRSLLTRWADNLSDQFELDDDERRQVRKAVVERWNPFLNENRRDLQPLFNEFLEMRLAVDPPTKEEVKRWADRALPVFERFHEQTREGTAEFREIVPPSKRSKFAAEALQLGVGLQVAEQKLKQWQQGHFEPEEVWTPPRSQRRARRALAKEQGRSGSARQRRSERRSVGHQQAGQPGPIYLTEDEARVAQDDTVQSEPEDHIALELHRWDLFVEDAIRRYRFDKAQQTAALSFLSELKQRASDHRDRRKEAIAQMEYRIRHHSGSEKDLIAIKAQLIELYGPIDDMFKELQSRVESVATTEQKIRAAQQADKPKPVEHSE